MWNELQRYMKQTFIICHLIVDSFQSLGAIAIQSRICPDNVHLVYRIYTSELHMEQKRTPTVLIRKWMQLG